MNHRRRRAKNKRNQSRTQVLTLTDRISLYIAVITLFLSSLFSSYAIYQNSQALQTAQSAFQISIDSTIDITFPTEIYGSEISIQNTSSVDITKVRVFPICYYIKKENDAFKIISRIPLEPVSLPVEILKPGQKSQIPLKAASCVQLPKNSGDYTNSLVVVFHRQIDNKRFVKIEPFTMSEDDPNPEWASSLYAEGRWEGDPFVAVGITQEIRKTEEVFFRVDK